MSMVSRFMASGLVAVFSAWLALAGPGGGSARDTWAAVLEVEPLMNCSASGPGVGGVGCSGRLNLLFASAIGEPHQLFDQGSNLLGGLLVARARLFHLDNREPLTGGFGVADPLLNLG